MFWLRNKKDNFQLCTLILGPVDVMPQAAEFHQDLHCLLRTEQYSGKNILKIRTFHKYPIKIQNAKESLLHQYVWAKSIYNKTCLKRPLKKKTKHWFSRPIIA